MWVTSSAPSPSEGQFQGVSARFLGRSRVGLVVVVVQGIEPQVETVPIPAPTFYWVSTFCPILLDSSLWLLGSLPKYTASIHILVGGAPSWRVSVRQLPWQGEIPWTTGVEITGSMHCGGRKGAMLKECGGRETLTLCAWVCANGRPLLLLSMRNPGGVARREWVLLNSQDTYK